jgi:hypothetical protein
VTTTVTYEEFDDLFTSHVPIPQGNVLIIDGVKAHEMIKENAEHARRWFNDYISQLHLLKDEKSLQLVICLLMQIATYFKLYKGDESFIELLNNNYRKLHKE